VSASPSARCWPGKAICSADGESRQPTGQLRPPGLRAALDDLGALLGDDDTVTLRHLRPVRLKGVGVERAWVLRRAA
jgi:hypothetical protein